MLDNTEKVFSDDRMVTLTFPVAPEIDVHVLQCHTSPMTLSREYGFFLTVMTKKSLPVQEILHHWATMTWSASRRESFFHGIVARITQNNDGHYVIELRPPFYKLENKLRAPAITPVIKRLNHWVDGFCCDVNLPLPVIHYLGDEAALPMVVLNEHSETHYVRLQKLLSQTGFFYAYVFLKTNFHIVVGKALSSLDEAFSPVALTYQARPNLHRDEDVVYDIRKTHTADMATPVYSVCTTCSDLSLGQCVTVKKSPGHAPLQADRHYRIVWLRHFFERRGTQQVYHNEVRLIDAKSPLPNAPCYADVISDYRIDTLADVANQPDIDPSGSYKMAKASEAGLPAKVLTPLAGVAQEGEVAYGAHLSRAGGGEDIVVSSNEPIPQAYLFGAPCRYGMVDAPFALDTTRHELLQGRGLGMRFWETWQGEKIELLATEAEQIRFVAKSLQAPGVLQWSGTGFSLVSESAIQMLAANTLHYRSEETCSVAFQRSASVFSNTNFVQKAAQAVRQSGQVVHGQSKGSQTLRGENMSHHGQRVQYQADAGDISLHARDGNVTLRSATAMRWRSGEVHLQNGASAVRLGRGGKLSISAKQIVIEADNLELPAESGIQAPGGCSSSTMLV